MDRSLITAGSLALAAVGVALFMWPAEVEPPPLVLAASSTGRSVTVHVSGAVVRPGLVTVAADARVADVIAAVGGATAEAELGAVNLAARITDGTRLVVPGSFTSGEAVGDGLIRLNSASPAEIEALPGVGPVLAGRIVAYREAQGSFEAVEDLLGVPGIGEAKLSAIRDLVLVP